MDAYVEAISAKRMETTKEIVGAVGAVIWICSPYSIFAVGQSAAVDERYTTIQ